MISNGHYLEVFLQYFVLPIKKYIHPYIHICIQCLINSIINFMLISSIVVSLFQIGIILFTTSLLTHTGCHNKVKHR